MAEPATTAEREIVFATRGLTKVYLMGEVEIHALRGVDLDLIAGELTVLLGASGSGKSTLLNILGGLDRATGGRVRYGDQDLARASEQALTAFRRDHVGFVFQFYNLIASLTARENVALVTEIVPDPMAPEEALALVGLDHRLDHEGQVRQLVATGVEVGTQPVAIVLFLQSRKVLPDVLEQGLLEGGQLGRGLVRGVQHALAQATDDVSERLELLEQFGLAFLLNLIGCQSQVELEMKWCRLCSAAAPPRRRASGSSRRAAAINRISRK